jgi:hypothetical protein
MTSSFAPGSAGASVCFAWLARARNRIWVPLLPAQVRVAARGERDSCSRTTKAGWTATCCARSRMKWETACSAKSCTAGAIPTSRTSCGDGIDIVTVATWAGHDDIKVTRSYAAWLDSQSKAARDSANREETCYLKTGTQGD